MPSVKFIVKRVRKLLLTLYKIARLDQIILILLKNCSPDLASGFTKLLQLSYDSRIFSSSRKAACVQPLPKWGSKTLPSTYRPIARLSAINEVLEKIRQLWNSRLPWILRAYTWQIVRILPAEVNSRPTCYVICLERHYTVL